MIKNSNCVNFTIFRVNDSGGDFGGKPGLDVDTEQLLEYGKFLINAQESIDLLVTNLDSAVQGITSGWGDSNGETLTSKFQSFVGEARGIGEEIGKLGSFAVNEASKYDDILSTSLSMMSGGE